jgi:hypothetical protein
MNPLEVQKLARAWIALQNAPEDCAVQPEVVMRL